MTAIIGFRRKGSCILITDNMRSTRASPHAEAETSKNVVKLHKLSNQLMVAQGGDSIIGDAAVETLRSYRGNLSPQGIEEIFDMLSTEGQDWAGQIRTRWGRDLPTYLVFGMMGSNGIGRHVSYSLSDYGDRFDSDNEGAYFTGSNTRLLEHALSTASGRLKLPSADKLSEFQIRQLSKLTLCDLSKSMPREIGADGTIGILSGSRTSSLVIENL